MPQIELGSKPFNMYLLPKTGSLAMQLEEKSMLDITRIMCRYMEAKRNIWNTYFLNSDYSYDDDILDNYDNIDKSLFSALVINNLRSEKMNSINHNMEPNPYILVVPDKNLMKHEVNVCPPPSGNRLFKKIVIDFSQRIQLEYICFYEWNQYGFVSYPYFMARIAKVEDHPELVGWYMLIETLYAKVYYITSLSNSTEQI